MSTERYRAKCIVCGFGNCQAALINCPREMQLDLHRQLLPQYERELAAERAAVPNRLYGAEINHRGEAI